MEKNSRDELLRAYVLLKSLRNNIDQIGSVPEKYVNEYHTILEKIEKNVNITLTEFRIPEPEIKPQPRSFNPRSGTVYSSEKYVARPFMLTKMDAVLGYFETITSSEPPKMGFRTSKD